MKWNLLDQPDAAPLPPMPRGRAAHKPSASAGPSPGAQPGRGKATESVQRASAKSKASPKAKRSPKRRQPEGDSEIDSEMASEINQESPKRARAVEAAGEAEMREVDAMLVRATHAAAQGGEEIYPRVEVYWTEERQWFSRRSLLTEWLGEVG
jgi:hypothetical protein